jgi:hypothetical protein
MDAGKGSDATTGSDASNATDAVAAGDSPTSVCGGFYTTGIAECDACLIVSCCALEKACVPDANCENCVGAGNTMGTFNCIAEDANATALVNCYKAFCVTACGG